MRIFAAAALVVFAAVAIVLGFNTHTYGGPASLNAGAVVTVAGCDAGWETRGVVGPYLHCGQDTQ